MWQRLNIRNQCQTVSTTTFDAFAVSNHFAAFTALRLCLSGGLWLCRHEDAITAFRLCAGVAFVTVSDLDLALALALA